MANKQTDKSRYPSRYAPDKYVTAAQYITELVCERRAKMDKDELPTHFWNLPEWRQFFLAQIKVAHQLLEKYHAQAIIQALRDDKRLARTFSLKGLLAPWAAKIVNDYHQKIVARKKMEKTTIQTPSIVSTVPTKPREKQKRRSLLGTLRELDDVEDTIDGEEERRC